jgi:HEPN domain-containing protein
MVKDIKRREAMQYLVQAEEFLASARQSMESDRYNATGFNAVQAMINANDALTIFYLEQRASTDHREGIKLHADVVKLINDGSQRERLKEAMQLRSEAGYMGTAISKNDAERILRNAAQFIAWIRKYVK